MAKKILVIEDQPEMLKIIAVRLKSEGYQVVMAKDGQEGINKVDSDKPDLVVADLALPKITGNVIVRIMKQSEKHRNIPVIILSAFVHPNMGKGVEFPADAYLPKPFKAPELMETIRQLLERSQAG